MARFRKKPVVIDAMHFDGTNPMPVLVWAASFGDKAQWIIEEEFTGNDKAIIIPTLEGELRASAGDWIIRGIKGEFYPCKPEIFDATYEAVE